MRTARKRNLRPLIYNGDGTVSIELTRGKYALIDEADATHPVVSSWSWYAVTTPRHSTWYASSRAGLLHVVLMEPSKGVEVDHEDGNGLHNCRSNLRVVTHQENTRNSRLNRNNSSGYIGVNLLGGKWAARICDLDGNRLYLGRFSDPAEAAMAYDEKAMEIDPEHYRLNFPR